MDYCIHCPFHIDLGHIKHTTLFWTILTAVDCISKAAHFVPLSKLPTVHPWRLLNSYWTMLLGFMGFLSTLCQTMGLSSSPKYGKLFVNPWELMLVCLLVTTHSRGGNQATGKQRGPARFWKLPCVVSQKRMPPPRHHIWYGSNMHTTVSPVHPLASLCLRPLWGISLHS